MNARFQRHARALLGLASLLALGACNFDHQPTLPAVNGEGLTLVMYVSSEVAAPGERIAISVTPEYNGELAGFQGFFNFDATRLRYVGQGTLSDETILLVNTRGADRGQLRFGAMNPQGLRGSIGPLVFQVLRPGYTQGLEFQAEEAVTAGQKLTRIAKIHVMPFARLSSAVRVPSDVQRLTATDWIERVEPGKSKDFRNTVATVPGQIVPGLVYGNVNLNTAGQQVTLSDAISTLNVSVGLNEMIINTDTPAPGVDAVIAMNVEPANSPGLGEPNDALPPGNLTVTDLGAITLSDAVAILNGAVGIVHPIVNNAIPGRPAAPATNRIVVSTNITTNTTWTKNNIYELSGGITVTGGATLTIEPGTLIEGQRGSSPGVGGSTLFVARDGRIIADGTPREPIVLTCVGAGKFKGCWGGFVVNGNATLNEGTQTSPIVAGRAATGGCFEKSGEGNSGLYGGCNPTDSSGVIRYVRVEYAGFRFTPTNELNGLALQGVGNKTLVDYVQVTNGLDDGIEFFGGTVNVKHIVSTLNSDDGFDWVESWSGRAQFIIVQEDSLDADKGFEGDNTNTSFDALPRALPLISNVTIVGRATQVAAGGTPGPVTNNDVEGGMHIRRGTRPVIHNAIVMGEPWLLNLDDASTCVTDASGGPIEIKGSIFFAATGGTIGSGDANFPAGCGTNEQTWLQTASFNNLFVDPQLRSPFSQTTPDFRPANGSPATNGIAPPNDPFFDATATFRGAVPAANTANANIPWYAGWTRFGL